MRQRPRQRETQSHRQKPVQGLKREGTGRSRRERANTHLEKEEKKPADRPKNPGGCRRQKPSPSAVSGPIAPRFPSLAGSSLAGKGLFSGCVCEGSGRRAEVSLSLFRPGLCVYLHVTGLSGQTEAMWSLRWSLLGCAWRPAPPPGPQTSPTQERGSAQKCGAVAAVLPGGLPRGQTDGP